MKDYFRKPNIAKSYSDMFERTSEAQLQYEHVYKHSEFKKPYESGSYDDMELMSTPSFNFPRNSPQGWDYPGDIVTTTPWTVQGTVPGTVGKHTSFGPEIPFPEEPHPPVPVEDPFPENPHPPNPPNPPKPKVQVFYCWTNDCFMPGKCTNVPFHCTFTITDIEKGFFTLSAEARGTRTFPVQGNIRICSTKDETGPLDFTIWGTKDPDLYNLGGLNPYHEGKQDTDLHIPGCDYTNCLGDDGDPVLMHYTTKQMAVNDTQTLYVENANSAGDYMWECNIGTIGPTGSTTTYTAPATNPGCTTAVITLKDKGDGGGGSTCSTLNIAVSANVSGSAIQRCCDVGGVNHCNIFGTCLGVWGSTNAYCLTNCGADSGTGSANPCGAFGNPPNGVITDIRDAAMIAAGCCPYQLL